jgi:hypothetical protein
MSETPLARGVSLVETPATAGVSLVVGNAAAYLGWLKPRHRGVSLVEMGARQ